MHSSHKFSQVQKLKWKQKLTAEDLIYDIINITILEIGTNTYHLWGRVIMMCVSSTVVTAASVSSSGACKGLGPLVHDVTSDPESVIGGAHEALPGEPRGVEAILAPPTVWEWLPWEPINMTEEFLLLYMEVETMR